MRALLFSLAPGMHETLCALFKSGVSVCHSQTPLAFQARFSGGSSSCCLTPRLGSLTWGPGVLLLWENFCGIIIFQFVVCPPGGYGICFYRDCAPPIVLLWLLLCLWMEGIFFGRIQHFFVNGCSAAGCDFGIFVRRDEFTSFFSTILRLSQEY